MTNLKFNVEEPKYLKMNEFWIFILWKFNNLEASLSDSLRIETIIL